MSFGQQLFSQGEANVWYFGQNAGLNFPFGPPVALTNGMCNTSEGSASIADAAGNLLFYTDGITVWNKLHAVMANGAGLQGNSSSTQSGVIIKQPGNPNLYYVFTTAAQGAVQGLRYSVVDMSLAAGNGSVTTKNVLLQTPTCEKITGVRHCNNIDVWIVTHDFNTNAFRTFLLTSAGVGAPVVSNVGLTPTGAGGSETIGQLKASPDGKKLGSCIWASTQNRFELFDFNNSTGVVSNAILLPQQTASSGAYGCEFSPDNTKFYGTTITPGKIYQWNLCAGSNAAIAASGVQIGQSANNFNGSMQLGPDKKIYVARYGVPWVGVINNPNTLGAGCGYVDNGASLGTKNGSLGLPNFVPYYFKVPPPPFTFTLSCLTASFSPPTATAVVSCSSATNAITSYLWNFGDPPTGALNTSTLSNPVHVFSGPGNYTVTLVLGYACGSDTLKNVVAVTAPSLAITSTSATCSTPGSATVNVIGGAGPFTYTWLPSNQTSSVATGLGAGIHSVTVSSPGGCSQTGTTNIGSNNAMTTTVITTSVSCNGGSTGAATITVGGGSGNYGYLWTPGAQTGSVASGLTAGQYSVTVTDLTNPCSTTKTLQIVEPTAMTLTALSNTPTACTGSSISLTASAAGGTGAYSYTWTGGPQTAGYQVAQATGGSYTYSVTAADANNCIKNTAITVSFVTTPTVTASSATICNGQTATLNAGGATTYTWTGGSTGSSYTNNPVSNLNVTVTGENSGCTATATAAINVNPLPQINFTNVNVLCNGQNNGSSSANTSSGTAPFTYTWNTMPVQNTATASSIPAGTYTVTVSDANNCVNTASTQITQPATLTLSANSSTTQACAGTAISANANAGGGTAPYNYSWSQGPTAANISINETNPGSYGYTVTLTDANNCTISANINLTFHPQPTITATSATVCAGQTAVLTAQGGNTYLWQPGNITGSTYTFSAQNNMNVSVTGEANGCSNSANTMIYVNPLPNANITTNISSGCVPMCFNYSSSSTNNITSYSWLVNGAGLSSNASGNHCFTTPANYTLNLSVTDNNGCSNNSNPLVLAVHPQPVADFNHAPIKPIINIDGEVHFTDASYGATITSWNWYFMNTAQYTSTQQNPSFLYTEPGTYAVALVVKSDKGCTDTLVRPLIVGEDYGLYVPNAFTPNADGLNDIFQPKGFGIVKYQLQIFDRWGERIYETKEINAGWDGTYHGKGVNYGKTIEEGVYTWLINVTNVFGKAHELKGHVTLIK